MRRTILGIICGGLLALPLGASAQAGHAYVVTVDFGTAPENFDRFKTMMEQNAKASVADEPGCREFNVYEVAATPNHLFLYEVYDDEAALIASSQQAFKELETLFAADETPDNLP